MFFSFVLDTCVELGNWFRTLGNGPLTMKECRLGMNNSFAGWFKVTRFDGHIQPPEPTMCIQMAQHIKKGSTKFFIADPLVPTFWTTTSPGPFASTVEPTPSHGVMRVRWNTKKILLILANKQVGPKYCRTSAVYWTCTSILYTMCVCRVLFTFTCVSYLADFDAKQMMC